MGREAERFRLVVGNASFLRDYSPFTRFLKRLYEDFTWYAHIGACLLDPSHSLRYIGRHTKRAVLAEYRITFYDGNKARYAFIDYAEGGKTSFKALSVLAFIGRLVRHIPDKHYKMVRYSGLFAPRWKSHYQVPLVAPSATTRPRRGTPPMPHPRRLRFRCAAGSSGGKPRPPIP